MKKTELLLLIEYQLHEMKKVSLCHHNIKEIHICILIKMNPNSKLTVIKAQFHSHTEIKDVIFCKWMAKISVYVGKPYLTEKYII